MIVRGMTSELEVQTAALTEAPVLLHEQGR